MKAKACFFWVIIIFIISIEMVYPQSIQFNSPSQNQVVTNTNSGSETNITINYTIGGTKSSNNQTSTVLVRIYDQNRNLIGGHYVTTDQNGNFSYSNSLQWVPGSYELSASLDEDKYDNGNWQTTAAGEVSFYVKHTIYVNNNIPVSFNVDGTAIPSGSTTVYKFISDGLSLGATDQLYNGYYYTWNTGSTDPSNWKRKGMNEGWSNISGATSRNYTYTVASNDNGAIITSDLRKKYYITFQNYMINLGNTGVINVSGTQYNSPSSNNIVVDGSQITATAPT